ncbi:uncharacterized protein LOC108916382, partial [Anoplophora glabripennis]|uniref:uncharacterized protein LOC108916382 n=1 Tax=Anoplophora glabripennis TaxID=217634 RepID=UPI00087580F9
MVENKENCIMTDHYNRIQGAIIKTQHKNYFVYKGVNTVGRNKSAIINLKNLNVSQNHAVIIIVDDAQHFISDLNSSNGTYLLGTKLSPYKLYELVNDVEIKFGDVSASYCRVCNMDTTVHLRRESTDMTQNITQNFYEAGTQLMINESSLNKSGPDNKTHRFCSDSISDNDIHEVATQVVDYQLASTSATVPDEPIGKCQSDSLENGQLNKQREVDIHEMPTHVDDLPQELTKVEKRHEMDIHEMPTQVVDLPLELRKLKEQEMDIHEMPTQVIDLPRNLNSVEKCQEVNLHEMQTEVVNMPQGLELSEKSSDSCTQIDDIHNSEELIQSRAETNSDTEGNELFVQKTSNMSTVEETVIEETVIDENHLEKDIEEESNESIDFLATQKPVSNEYIFNKEVNSANDNDSVFSDSQGIGIPRKRPLRKLSSSEDLSQPHENKIIYNSDSDTDIEKEIDIRINNQKLPIKEADLSGSDTEIEDDLPRQIKKHSKVLNSDSETDIEEHVSYKDISTQSQDIIKPKILNKRLLDSDSETDIEDNKENDIILKQTHDKTNNDTLNDTDCIPATQDAFADMFAYKNSKVSSNANSQNESSEESFKLGLTELMVESVENKKENDIHEDKTNDLVNEESISNVKNDNDNDKKLGNNEEHTLSNSGDVSNSIENKIGEDLYLNPTQKICTDPKPEFNQLNEHHVEALSVNQAKTSVISDTAQETNETEDDIYLMPTQKLNENEVDNKPTSCTSKNINMEADEDFYMMPTQKQNNNQPEFKTPQKKYTFKKKKVKLDGSLSSIFSKSQDDLYSAPVQKINEEGAETEDIYLQPTQKLNEEQKQRDPYLQPTQDLNMAAHKDEDLYMAPTQKLNEEQKQCNLYLQPTQDLNSTAHKDEDLFGEPTQKLNEEQKQRNLYLQETQDLSLATAHKDEDLYLAPTQQVNINVGENNTAQDKAATDSSLQENQHVDVTTDTVKKRVEKINEDLYMAATQPVNPSPIIEKTDKISPSKSILDLYLQETQDLSPTKNTESNKNKLETSSTTMKQTNKFEDKNETSQDRSNLNLQTIKDTNLDAGTSLKTSGKHNEDLYLAETQPVNPNIVVKKLNKPLNDLYVQETEDIGLTKNLEANKDENNEDPYMIPTQQINQDLVENSSSANKDNFKASDLPKAVVSKTRLRTKRQIQSDTNTSELSKKRKLTDVEMEKLNQVDAVIKEPLSTLKKPNKYQGSPSVPIPKEKATKTVTDQSETLSQIQRFVAETSKDSKKTKVKTLPKKRSSAEAQIEVQSETLSQIEAFIKKPLSTVKENTDTPSKRKKRGKVSDKTKQVHEEFQKPETSLASRRTRSTSHPKTHVSKEECETFINPEFDLSTSSDKSERETVKSDVEKSFALLEAKSTKTRKSQRVINSSEVKVSVCKNRRSMATCAVPETSKSRIENIQSPPNFTSPEKGKRKQKPKIVFTMLDSPLLESLIRQMGGTVVDSVESSTVLVTGQVKRSQKLLTAVGQGKPICSPDWIHASKKANEFL